MRVWMFLVCSCMILTAYGQLPAFNPAGQPAAPDYSDVNNWSALPFREDAADVIPGEEQWIDDSLKEVDVFFVYPTIYEKGKTWNADVRDKKLNKQIDKRPIRYQASVFNASCRVYAPRYRQAHVQAFYDKENGPQALAFAYQDVKEAFRYYMKHYNNGRPVIIASHSQGTYHARELLKEFFDTTDLGNQLVAAYLIGYGIDEQKYQTLHPCGDATQTNCYITWASYKKGFDPGVSQLYGNVCVNPLSWKRDNVFVAPSENEGTLPLNFNKKYEHACSAQIHENYLWVSTDLPVVRKMNVLHVADYNLFWFDIRKNVKERVGAFMKR